jgi:hypothetical protein
MRLTAYIVSAADGELVVATEELSDLRTVSKTVHTIPEAVRTEAARITGQAPEDFQVKVRY